MKILLLLLSFWQMLAYEVLFAINCGTHTYNIVPTKFFNYTVDTYFEGLASMAQTKNNVPQSISHQTDRQLIKTHRTSSPGYMNFSYRPILSENGYYIAIVAMIQTEYKAKGQRIINIKLGDQIVHTVDILAQVGFGKILHKWIQIDIRQDIAYLNGTIPALNAFNFRTRQVRIVFDGIKNKPKIETLILLKGTDSHQYLKQFLQNQQQKSIKVKQYIAQKYRKQPKLTYRPLLESDIIMPPDSQFTKIYNKYFTFRSLASVVCGILAIHYEKILKFISGGLDNLYGKLKDLKKGVSNKKKKQ